MIAKIAYLTSPAPGCYVINYQPFGSNDLTSIELAPEQMRNILIDGVTLMLRHSFHRVPVITIAEDANERAGA